MKLIDINILAMSSYIDVNIYSFDALHKSFDAKKTLTGHKLEC